MKRAQCQVKVTMAWTQGIEQINKTKQKHWEKSVGEARSMLSYILFEAYNSLQFKSLYT